jgi:gag-polypeptide of LTR copia-type
MSSGSSIGGATSTSSMTGNTGDTSIRVIIFSGKREDWETWSEKFFVKASIRGYEGVLSGEESVPETHDDKGVKVTTLTAAQKEIVEANKRGYGDLILSIDCTTSAGKVAFAMIKGSKTTKNPGGLLRTAYLRLKQKYEPNTTPQLMQLTRDFHSKTMKPNQDPDVFITDLEALKVKMAELNHEVSDKALILHVLNNLSDHYEMEVKMLEHKMQLYKDQTPSKELSIEEVRTELNLRYERLKKAHGKHHVIEHALYMGGKFKGKCHWCGKIGHKASECRLKIAGKPKLLQDNNKGFSNVNNNSNNNGNNKRKDLFCSYCKKKGHEVNECRKKKRDEGAGEINMTK